MVQIKKCSRCGIEKSLEDFYNDKKTNDGKSFACKCCMKKYSKENEEKLKIYHKGHYKTYISKNKEKTQYYQKNYQKKYREENKEQNKEYQKLYRDEHKKQPKEKIKKQPKEKIKKQPKIIDKDKIYSKMKEYNYINKDKLKIYNKNYQRERRQKDPIFKLKGTVTSNIIRSLKMKKTIKKNRTVEILGCSIEFFKEYLEEKFEQWMDWSNHGLYNGVLNYGWDLDHIIPISSAQTEEEILSLNHYSNFQPLCSKINRDIKMDKLDFIK